MKSYARRYYLLFAFLILRNSNATEPPCYSYSNIKQITAPDTNSLWASDKLMSNLNAAIDAKELSEFVEKAIEGCTDESMVKATNRDPRKCWLLDNLISATNTYNYQIITAEWLSGQCGASGLCATIVFDVSRKHVVYRGDTHGITAFNGKLYAIDNNGKAIPIKTN